MHNLDTVNIIIYNMICSSLILTNSDYVNLVSDSSDDEDLRKLMSVEYGTDMTSDVSPSTIHVAEPSTIHVTQPGSATFPWYV